MTTTTDGGWPTFSFRPSLLISRVVVVGRRCRRCCRGWLLRPASEDAHMSVVGVDSDECKAVGAVAVRRKVVVRCVRACVRACVRVCVPACVAARSSPLVG